MNIFFVAVASSWRTCCRVELFSNQRHESDVPIFIWSTFDHQGKYFSTQTI